MSDATLRLLANLQQAEPDRARTARVRTACQATLARRQARRPARPSRSVNVWQAIVGGLAGVYLLETIRLALTLSGTLGLY